MLRQKKRKKSTLFRTVLILLLIVCAFILGKQEYQIYIVQREQENTQQRIDILNKQKADLEAERRHLDDLHYIEKLAREDYNMVRPNEVPLFVVDENK